jgi:hypothetical protein
VAARAARAKMVATGERAATVGMVAAAAEDGEASGLAEAWEAC